MAQQGHCHQTEVSSRLELQVREEGVLGSGLCSFIHLLNARMPAHTGDSSAHQTLSCPQEPIGMNCCFALWVHWLTQRPDVG